MEFFQSHPIWVILGILAAYFALKLICVASRVWTPRHRLATLDEKQLRGWRITASLEALGMALLWLGLLLGLVLTPYAFALAAAGAVVYALFKVRMMKKYPYIDPATVKKSGGKKKKKK